MMNSNFLETWSRTGPKGGGNKKKTQKERKKKILNYEVKSPLVLRQQGTYRNKSAPSVFEKVLTACSQMVPLPGWLNKHALVYSNKGHRTYPWCSTAVSWRQCLTIIDIIHIHICDKLADFAGAPRSAELEPASCGRSLRVPDACQRCRTDLGRRSDLSLEPDTEMWGWESRTALAGFPRRISDSVNTTGTRRERRSPFRGEKRTSAFVPPSRTTK